VEDNIKDSCHCGFYFLYLDRCSKNKLKQQKTKLYKQDTVSAIQCRVLHHGPTNKPLTYWKIDLKPCKLHDWQILYIFEPRDNLIITHLREKKNNVSHSLPKILGSKKQQCKQDHTIQLPRVSLHRVNSLDFIELHRRLRLKYLESYPFPPRIPLIMPQAVHPWIL